jgi:hypothetical protein
MFLVPSALLLLFGVKSKAKTDWVSLSRFSHFCRWLVAEIPNSNHFEFWSEQNPEQFAHAGFQTFWGAASDFCSARQDLLPIFCRARQDLRLRLDLASQGSRTSETQTLLLILQHQQLARPCSISALLPLGAKGRWECVPNDENGWWLFSSSFLQQL